MSATAVIIKGFIDKQMSELAVLEATPQGSESTAASWLRGSIFTATHILHLIESSESIESETNQAS